MCVSWLMHLCDMTHSYVSHDSFAEYRFFYSALLQKKPINLRSLLIIATQYHSKQTHSCVCHGWFINVTWLIWLMHICDMTHSYVSHNTFRCVPLPCHECDRTTSYVWHDSFVRGIWRIEMCDMTHSNVCHDSFVRVTWLIHITHHHSMQIIPAPGTANW